MWRRRVRGGSATPDELSQHHTLKGTSKCLTVKPLNIALLPLQPPLKSGGCVIVSRPLRTSARPLCQFVAVVRGACMKDRKSLTKSLHTITAVSGVARYLQTHGGPTSDLAACRAALEILGQANDWSAGDPTLALCVAKVKALREAKS
jgi:hypothetical protein